MKNCWQERARAKHQTFGMYKLPQGGERMDPCRSYTTLALSLYKGAT